MQIFKNPKIISLNFGNSNFQYLNNPMLVNGEQIINSFQNTIFENIGSGISKNDLLNKANIDSISLEKTLSILKKKDFISEGINKFQEPKPRIKNNSLSLWVHTSNKCNLACSYCYVTAEKNGKLMTDETLDKILQSAVETVRKNKVKRLRLKFAGGEPLLTFRSWSVKMEPLKNKLDELGVTLDIQIITNGTILSDSILEFIKCYNVGVGFSLDGYGIYQDKTRHFHNGKGSFDKVYQNLCKLRTAGIDPYITTVITEKNLEGLEEITKFFIEENLRFRFSIEKYNFPNIEKLIVELKKSYKLIEDNLSSYNNFLSHKLCDLSFDRPIVDTPCGVGASHASVNHNGNLHTCQTEQFEPEIGSVFTSNDILEVIKSQANVSELSKISESCKECTYKYNCSGGCPVTKVFNKSPFCHLFHAVIPDILKLRGRTILNEHIGNYN